MCNCSDSQTVRERKMLFISFCTTCSGRVVILEVKARFLYQSKFLKKHEVQQNTRVELAHLKCWAYPSEICPFDSIKILVNMRKVPCQIKGPYYVVKARNWGPPGNSKNIWKRHIHLKKSSVSFVNTMTFNFCIFQRLISPGLLEMYKPF